MDDLSMHEMKCISCNNFQALVKNGYKMQISFSI